MIVAALVLILLLFAANSMTKASNIPVIVTAYKDAITIASLRFLVPQSRIIAIIAQESSGNPTVTGSAGEVGLMQITPGALQDFDRVYGYSYSVADLLDPAKNILVGTGYLAWLRNQLAGNLDRATQAYNVGIGNVEQSSEAGKNYLASVLEYEKQVPIT